MKVSVSMNDPFHNPKTPLGYWNVGYAHALKALRV